MRQVDVQRWCYMRCYYGSGWVRRYATEWGLEVLKGVVPPGALCRLRAPPPEQSARTAALRHRP